MIENFLQLTILALAVARLTLLIVRDDIFEPVRNLIFYVFPPENSASDGWYYQNYHRVSYRVRPGKQYVERRYRYEDAKNVPLRKPTFIGEALSCPDCAGVWVAAAIFGAYLAFPTATLYGSSVLALAMVNSLIARKYH